MAKKKYGVTCTLIYNGYLDVEAESEEEAFDIAREKLSNEGYPYEINEFNFGEVTADDIEEITEDI